MKKVRFIVWRLWMSFGQQILRFVIRQGGNNTLFKKLKSYRACTFKTAVEHFQSWLCENLENS